MERDFKHSRGPQSRERFQARVECGSRPFTIHLQVSAALHRWGKGVFNSSCRLELMGRASSSFKNKTSSISTFGKQRHKHSLPAVLTTRVTGRAKPDIVVAPGVFYLHLICKSKSEKTTAGQKPAVSWLSTTIQDFKTQ
ncbi:hypothetical protein O6H91_21G052200 [Diphasiastrum complanatum]|uniref:Uncharacterized protein n=2 Tax=Diphasiastrum complanatum TaxID=34168 RepID=A0ACC2AKG2_DIPCM|nr:hypothetical protein O6H91_21G052200 [Diphasiastrum complanatum]KAJ7518047.1 hypothetical protein O6H91_21G052200 [Diphasiastrum complanatum]